MPPKRGRGRGRGAPRDRQDTDAFPGRQQRFQRNHDGQRQSQPERQPTEFFAVASSSEAAHDNPSAATPKHEAKLRSVHPEEVGIELKQNSPIKSALLMPRRPGFGTLGRRISLIANCYPIQIPSGYVYHYDVTIINKEVDAEETATSAEKNTKRYRCLLTKTNRKVISQLLERDVNFKDLYAAFDGKKNLYTRKELKVKFPLKCEVIGESSGNIDASHDRKDLFVVEIKPVIKKETDSCAISLDTVHALFENKTTSLPQEAIMALETILRHGPCSRFTPIGRSFFYPPSPGNLHPLGGGLEIWFGYHQSIRLGQWKPMVNLDISAATFLRQGPVLNYIAEFMDKTVRDLRRIPALPNPILRKLSNKMKDKWIEVTHLPYRKKCRILELDRRNANEIEIKFDDKEEEKTVAKYFKERYSVDLEFPNLPCLSVKKGEKGKIFYPIEVCNFIPGQHSKTELTLSQKNEMIKFTSVSPKERFTKIDRIMSDKANFNNDRCVQEFDLKVYPKPMSLEGRVLEPPNLIYRDQCNREKKICPKNGSWDLRDTQFFDGAEIDRWGLLSFAAMDRYYLDEFSKCFLRIGNELGIRVTRPTFIRTVNAACNVRELLSEVKRRAKLAVVVLPILQESEIYCKIKEASEIEIGLLTQCVKEATVRRIVDEKTGSKIVSNILLKVNAKMGGENHTICENEIPAFLWKPIIIIGADVNHPDPSGDIKPSLAACVGSINMYFSRYAVSIKPQINRYGKRNDEIIHDLKQMVVDLLKAFYRNTEGKKPEKIIFYRDGVSEGQFEKVRDQEVKSIREACRSLEKEYEPGITFIAVQKRHHVRFMPKDPRDGVGKKNNVPPGTTVDTTVIHPLNFDFFMCSQFGLQGTSRPSHYVVIEDDNNLTANDVQKMTFQLCHMSARCTKSISIPAPVAYAHYVAYRARKHLKARFAQADELYGSEDGSDSSISSLLQEAMDAIQVKNELKCSMYFV